MYSEIVKGTRANEIYRDIRQLCRKVDVSNPDIKDEDLVKKVLGRNLITEPINRGEPFEVDNKTSRQSFSGQDFSVDTLRLTPKDTINGGKYEIQFTATNPSGELQYVLYVLITECPSMIRVNQARIDVV